MNHNFQPGDIAWYWTGNFTASRVRIKSLDGAGATRRAWVEVIDHRSDQQHSGDINGGQGLPVAVRMLEPIAKPDGFDAVQAVSDLMDDLGVPLSDVLMHGIIDDIRDNESPETFEPVDGDMVMTISTREAWDRLAESDAWINLDEIDGYEEQYDRVYDALERIGVLHEFEGSKD